MPALRAAICAHQRRCYGIELDPDDGVQVTFGATEAIAAALLGLLEPGDEVVAVRPGLRRLRGRRRAGRRRPPDGRAAPARLGARRRRAARRRVTGRARASLMLNTPHNPTGKVFSRDELEAVAAVCREHDLIAISDEVYEHLVFDGEHVPLATLAGMAERTLTISSLGKTFSVTGWKIGWATGPAELVGGGARGQAVPDASPAARRSSTRARPCSAWPTAGSTSSPARCASSRDRLCAGLEAAGLEVLVPQATYFANVLVDGDGAEFCRELPARCGVVAIPTGAFYEDPRSAATSSASRSASAQRSSTRPPVASPQPKGAWPLYLASA